MERERGITVKAQTASLFYNCEGKQYLLNLIDTPVSLILILSPCANNSANKSLFSSWTEH